MTRSGTATAAKMMTGNTASAYSAERDGGPADQLANTSGSGGSLVGHSDGDPGAGTTHRSVQQGTCSARVPARGDQEHLTRLDRPREACSRRDIRMCRAGVRVDDDAVARRRPGAGHELRLRSRAPVAGPAGEQHDVTRARLALGAPQPLDADRVQFGLGA